MWTVWRFHDWLLPNCDYVIFLTAKEYNRRVEKSDELQLSDRMIGSKNVNMEVLLV